MDNIILTFSDLSKFLPNLAFDDVLSITGYFLPQLAFNTVGSDSDVPLFDRT